MQTENDRLEKTRKSLSVIHSSLITLTTVLNDVADQVRVLEERMKSELNFRDLYLKGKYNQSTLSNFRGDE